MKKRQRIRLFTAEERALHAAHQQELELRIQRAEAELAAAGSPLRQLSRTERLTYSIRRLEAELGVQR